MTERISVQLQEEVLPPHDASHGTNHQMVRRTASIHIGPLSSTWEQTDYGHPGRFNPWDPRQTDAKLQPQTEQIRSVLTALSTLLG
jgi:hypothetical protein